jgi:hypothetical protein
LQDVYSGDRDRGISQSEYILKYYNEDIRIFYHVVMLLRYPLIAIQAKHFQQHVHRIFMQITAAITESGFTQMRSNIQ